MRGRCYFFFTLVTYYLVTRKCKFLKRKHRMISQILNFFAFQILWFGCVYGGGSLELTWMPWISLVPLILDTLYKSSRALDLKLATTAALLGYGLETIWVKLAILKFGRINSSTNLDGGSLVRICSDDQSFDEVFS